MSCSRGLPRDPAVMRLSELICRSGRGDERAFEDLYAATHAKLRKTARTVSPKLVDVEDLLQDAYLKIWKHAGSFDPARASPITWMCTILRNTAIDALRLKQVATIELDEGLSVPDPADQPADEFDYAFAQPIAAGVIERLPDDRRQLLSLAYLEGESRIQLSQRFGVPVGTVKTWLRRTLETVGRECRASIPAYNS
ncbi:RNA polymerase subunit sigma-70 [Bradyrhizobium guangdongense]|uniref:RNA polymerase sigma factor n=1 Tax=Bradyrhizobium guangdongense TaxID=1325090 RepID=UPI00112B3047|nr:sigma-70 family RNA polymerase sigma factor [Bradyrhizobium guangdongense]TPQ35361.1 RNA polymerase subunit sigma-70 [Bradyrhizobium guangdongense]